MDTVNNLQVQDTNFYNLQSSAHETLAMDNTAGTFTRCYFIKGGNSNTGWKYSNGFGAAAFTECVCSDISYNANDIAGKIGTSGGRTSIPIVHYKTWYMDADIPYQEKTTPARTLPTPCPPLPPQKQPRKLKRIVTTASNSLAPLITDYI